MRQADINKSLVCSSTVQCCIVKPCYSPVQGLFLLCYHADERKSFRLLWVSLWHNWTILFYHLFIAEYYFPAWLTQKCIVQPVVWEDRRSSYVQSFELKVVVILLLQRSLWDLKGTPACKKKVSLRLSIIKKYQLWDK